MDSVDIQDLKEQLSRATNSEEYDMLKAELDAAQKAESLRAARMAKAAEDQAAAELKAKHDKFAADIERLVGMAEEARTTDAETLEACAAFVKICDRRSALIMAADSLRRDLKVRAVALGIDPFTVPGRGGYADKAGGNDDTPEQLAKGWLNRFCDHRRVLARRAREAGTEPQKITLAMMSVGRPEQANRAEG